MSNNMDKQIDIDIVYEIKASFGEIDNDLIDIITKFYDGVVDKFKELESSDLNVECICGSDKDEHKFVILQLLALKKGYNDLAKKIADAIKIIKKERIEGFIHNAKEGTVEQFLASLSLDEKVCLMTDIGIEDYKKIDALCPGGREIIKILDDSIISELFETETKENINNIKIKKEKTPLAPVLHRSRKNGKFYKFN